MMISREKNSFNLIYPILYESRIEASHLKTIGTELFNFELLTFVYKS